VRARPKGCPLSEKQWEAVQGLERGATYAEIGVELGMAESTARTHLQRAYRKLGARRAAEAIVKLRAADWYPDLPPPPVDDEVPLPPAIKAYLGVFDRYLKLWARGPSDEERRARLECRYMLGGIYVEQGLRRAA
jgi:DNA-binding CsgD family transcriptional regulator